MKPILIHTHFHKRRTGVTRSIENVFSYFAINYESYVYGNTVNAPKISTFRLASLLFSKRKIVVHCHRNNEILRMLFFRFFGAKFKLFATRHAESTPSKFTLWLLQKADTVITLIQSMSANLGIENTVVGHGVLVDLFAPKPECTLDTISQKNLIICVGRVRKSKGQIVLLEAVKALKDHPEWALAIVGKVDQPDFLEVLKNLVKLYAIENQVYFKEETPEIISYYQAAKIVIAPSFSEGFSLVTAEGMSCGCTVIATKNVGVHSSLITHAKNGYLFEAGNSSELKQLIQQLIQEELPFVGEKAREEIVANWSAKKEADLLMQLYQK